jgi:hypothetical protein
MAKAYLYDLTDTWNAGATTFTALKMNVTDTASAAGSLLIDLQTGGTSRFNVTKNGAVRVVADSTIENGGADATYRGILSIAGNPANYATGLNGIEFKGSVFGSGYGFKITTIDSGGFFLDVASRENNATWSACFRLLTNGNVQLTASRSTVYHAGNLPGSAITWTASQTLSDVNLILGTTTGTKIGTATNQKLGFYNATPVVQPTAVADATDAATAITQLNALLSRMRNLGLIAT